MVEPIRIKDQFSLISGTKSIQDDTNIVADDDDGGADSDIADPDGDDEDPDDPEAFGDYEVCAERKTCVNLKQMEAVADKMRSVLLVSIISGIYCIKTFLSTITLIKTFNNLDNLHTYLY